MSFEAVAGRRYAFTTTQPSGVALTDTVIVYRPDQSIMATPWSYATTAFLEAGVATVSGTHTIYIDPLGAQTGTGTLTLHESVDATASVSVNGGTTNLSVSIPGQRGVVSFSGTSGTTLTVRLTGSTVGYIEPQVYKPDGTWLAGGWTAGSSLNLTLPTLPATGTYTIVVDPFGSTTGSVTVEVTNP